MHAAPSPPRAAVSLILVLLLAGLPARSLDERAGALGQLTWIAERIVVGLVTDPGLPDEEGLLQGVTVTVEQVLLGAAGPQQLRLTLEGPDRPGGALALEGTRYLLYLGHRPDGAAAVLEDPLGRIPLVGDEGERWLAVARRQVEARAIGTTRDRVAVTLEHLDGSSVELRRRLVADLLWIPDLREVATEAQRLQLVQALREETRPAILSPLCRATGQAAGELAVAPLLEVGLRGDTGLAPAVAEGLQEAVGVATAARAVVNSLRSGHPPEGRQALTLLLGCLRATEGGGALAELLEDRDPGVRATALWGLTRVRAPELAVPALLAAWPDLTTSQRHEACQAFHRQASTAAWAHLQRVAADEREATVVRDRAAQLLEGLRLR